MSSGTVATITGYKVGTWEVDPIHTEVGFSVRHMMVSNVRGRFLKFGAAIVIAENPVDSMVTATIDMASVDTGNEQRDNDLRSAGFFDVATYPTMTFRSSGIRPISDEDEKFLLDGDLTIRGITQSVTLEVQIGGFGPDPFGGTRVGFSATGEIKRSDFGMTGNMLIEGGGVVIADKVRINLEIEAVLKTETSSS